MAYRNDVDYQDLINKAVAAGDYGAAAQYERSRNEKIAALDASGTNKYNATATNNYSQYLNTNPIGSGKNVVTYNDAQKNILNKAAQNSVDWWSADDVGRAALSTSNSQLYGLLGPGVSYDSVSGTWSGTADIPTSMITGVGGSMPTFDISSLGSRPTFDVNEYLSSNPRPTFSYDDYVASNPQPTYESQYSQRIDTLLNQILNREQFSYDLESDPLYQQYKNQYIREGTRAMNDTLASAASGAGGMNSWAITAAQQANDYYNAQLNDRVPELYQLAYEMYLQDIDGQVRDLGLLQNLDNTQYGRYRDTMNDWYNDRDFAYGAYRDDMGDWESDRNFAYGAYRDDVGDWESDRDFALEKYRQDMGDYQWGLNYNTSYEQDARDEAWKQKEWDYNTAEADKKWEHDLAVEKAEEEKAANQTAYERAMDLLLMGVMPNGTLLANAGITEEEAKALIAKLNEVPAASTGSSGGGGGSGSGGSGGGGGGGGLGGGNDDEDEEETPYTPPKTSNSDKPRDEDKSNLGKGGKDDNYNPQPTTKDPVEEEEDVEVWNQHSDSWITIPGHGRYTWTEVESMVESGQVKEEMTSDGKLKYTWVNKKTGGTSNKNTKNMLN